VVPTRGDALDAVVLNVTATDATAAGYLTVWPCRAPRPEASAVNVVPGRTVADLVTVGADDGRVCVFNAAGRVHVVVDQLASYRPSPAAAVAAGRFVPVTPARALDTRPTGSRLAPGEVRAVDLTTAGVPADAAAAVVTVTAVDAPTGYWAVWGAGGWPGHSNLNADAAVPAAANQAVVAVDHGIVRVLSQRGGDLVVDVAGWFTGTGAPVASSGLFRPVLPMRALDSRRGSGPSTDHVVTVPAASAVALTVTVTGPVGDGYVVAYPAGTAVPLASNVNFRRADDVAGHVVVPAAGGRVALHANVPTDVVVDVLGTFT
jgi:hypothetical protein